MTPHDPQKELVEFLRAPGAYPHRPAEVAHFQTPISHVFVAAPYAYKLKKAVTLSFLDFGTLEKRRETCVDEVRLNRRLCAPIYLGVVEIHRRPDGTLALGAGEGDVGEPIEPLVWMRALPAEGMLPAALGDGRATADTLGRFGRDLARFHAAAPADGPSTAGSSPANLRAAWNDVLGNCAPAVGSLLSTADGGVLAEFGPHFLAEHRELFERRVAEGRIREVHGDLHATNLCLIEEPLEATDTAPEVPAGLYAFDCIEFSERLRWIDVASEVAFLAMDLEVRGDSDLATAFLAAYADEARDDSLLAVLPYYRVFRACVRGMVHAQTARDEGLADDVRAKAGRHAEEFFAYATHGAWRASGPLVVAFTGLSGSGKTALAARVSDATGFPHLSSDEIRKRRVGLDPLSPVPPDHTEALYGEDARQRVYEDLASEAAAHLRSGQSVITDATFHRRADRDALRAVARENEALVLFVSCTTDPDTIRDRLQSRARDAVPTEHRARSDADWKVYLGQVFRAEPLEDDEPHATIDTSGPLDRVLEETLGRLWAWRRARQTPATTMPRVTKLAATNDQPT